MKIGYFGGTFDPVHLGHLAAARAALEQLRLDRILFVPTDSPPHKRRRGLTAFAHRYAMVALALAEAREPRFIPSLLESAQPGSGFRYSIDTIHHLRRRLKKSDKIFFLIGIDAFMEIASWREPEALLRASEFVVISRPGYSLADAAAALPARLRPRTMVNRSPRGARLRTLRTGGVTIHLLEGVNVPISATELRSAIQGSAIRRGLASSWRRQVPRAVAAYIQKLHLYRKRTREVE